MFPKHPQNAMIPYPNGTEVTSLRIKFASSTALVQRQYEVKNIFKYMLSNALLNSIKGMGHCIHCWVSRWILGTFSRIFLLVYSYVNSKEAIISLSVRVSVFIMPEGLTLVRIKMARNVIFSRVVLLRS